MLLNFDKTKLPLAYIGHLSAIDTEEETLAATVCVFRIDQIVENKQGQRWDVNLTLNEEVNERLTTMIDQLQEEMDNQSTLMILGRLLLSELPHDHPDLGTVLNNLGIIAHKRNEHTEVIDLFQRALRVFLPEDHGDQSCVYANIGASYQTIGDDGKAIEAYEKAIESSLFSSDKARIYNNMVATHMNVAMAYANMQDYANALIYCDEAFNAIEILPIDNIRIGMTHFTVGFIRAQMDQHVAAIGHFSDALNAYHQITPSSVVTQEIIKTLYKQGRSYMELEQNTAALDRLRKILNVHRIILE